MDDFRPEPSLDELLEDPVARLVMARDGLTPTDVRRVIDAARERTANDPQRAPAPRARR